MAVKNVLIPSSLTLDDEKSLEFVVNRFVQEPDVQVTLYHGYRPAVEIEMRNNPIMDKMSATLSYQRQLLTKKENDLNLLKRKLLKNGFENEKVAVLFKPVKKDVAQAIVDLVREKQFDVIVFAHDPTKMKRFFTRSISEKVKQKLKNNVTIFTVN